MTLVSVRLKTADEFALNTPDSIKTSVSKGEVVLIYKAHKCVGIFHDCSTFLKSSIARERIIPVHFKALSKIDEKIFALYDKLCACSLGEGIKQTPEFFTFQKCQRV